MHIATACATFDELRLIVAGGYDPRVVENVQYYDELEQQASALELGSQVIFKASFTNAERSAMLGQGFAVVYTPSNEHFGIVPVEAMYSQRPVIAVNNGGPRESIVDGQTGYLCEADPKEFALAMMRLLQNRKAAQDMGAKGRARVVKRFSLSTFAARLHEIVMAVHGRAVA
jgi:alpha-1,3/alpha-1,6-mannosyltransferase